VTNADTNRPTAMRAMVVTKPIAPALPELTAAQELALLCRCLFSEGYDDHLAGHITYKQPDGTLLVNPFGLTWDEVTASDIMTMDADGNEISGRWTITPAITETDMASEMGSEQLKARVARYPMGRAAQPEEISQGVLFLASDESAFVTGADFRIDGGALAGVKDTAHSFEQN